ncbi:MAG: cytochrome c3 family protein [Deltaproteobacteria bacterium]|jgi:hypothetical protein|nr:cytochrome c3 family protein [Deltaproteobacteria bacterium]
MKKCILAPFALLILSLALPALSAQPAAPPDGIKLAKTKQPVTFNHSTHQKDMKCGDCHHVVNDKEDYGKCGNAGCHDSLDRKDKSAKGYYHVLHTKSGTKFATCASCHAQAAEKFPDKKKDLTACKQSKCHP